MELFRLTEWSRPEDNVAKKQSAGLLMFRGEGEGVEVFLVHPGGPFWAGKDRGAWTMPKGEYLENEEPLAAAIREFNEETGFHSAEPYLPLGRIRQKSGKVVEAWAFRGNCDAMLLVSNMCTIDWPPRSGKKLEIPEVDDGRWFSLGAAREQIREEQRPFLDRLHQLLG